ncbi:hypothetical protein SCUCBS95973_008144 [Sporothrix curviconia]|uniref:DUF4604 domain-containing protein n=1 Tax=Sporothrix curviconia TaxID=1260050 RepID=A0ABP0CJ71_9PEZI
MGKFNANSLSYDQSLPPFLARLHGQYNGGNRDGPDPILAAQRRAAKKRSASEEAEDAPLVLDDHGDVVAGVTFRKDGKATMDEAETEEDGADGIGPVGSGGASTSAREVDAVAGIGAGKKKRVGRVIGGGSDNEEDKKDNDKGNDNASTDRRKRKRMADEDTKDATEKNAKDKDGKDDKGKTAASSGSKGMKDKKKKKKKIQLSFEDDEDEG